MKRGTTHRLHVLVSKLTPRLNDAHAQSEHTPTERPKKAPESGCITEKDSLVMLSMTNSRLRTDQEGAGPPARSLDHAQIAPAA
eukprot:XP_001709726.1 Hypothetical protein GL50803_8762 [Giardia lamblia ATCC 50803]